MYPSNVTVICYLNLKYVHEFTKFAGLNYTAFLPNYERMKEMRAMSSTVVTRKYNGDCTDIERTQIIFKN